MDIIGIEGIQGILCEMAEVNLDYPFQAFMAALRDSGIGRDNVELVVGELFRQTLAFDANQIEWGKSKYNG
jgi:hypothetical protein